MIVRAGFLVAASVAAYTVRRIKKPRPPVQPSDNGDVEQHRMGEDAREVYVPEEDDVEEEEEEVKRVSSVNNPASDNPPFVMDDEEEDDILPEFEELLSGEIDFPLPKDKFDVSSQSEIENLAYEAEMTNHMMELERLRNLVKELEEREVKLEGELLEYYGLKEQESDVVELQRQLQIKTVEINMLNVTINSLQAERKKLQEEVSNGIVAKKELEMARNKIKELQKQIQLESGQTKGHLLMLKQQVTSLREKEEEASKKDAEVEKKLKMVKELEVEVVELRRKNKELQHEKRELTVKLDAAEARVTELSNMTESDLVARSREEINNLRHTNEDLSKQVEGLQMNRFSEVEELVYLRWVNACLRYELRNYQTPSGKISARDLNKNLSPRSQERAKQLMLEYAGSERGQGDTDLDMSSQPSSPGSEDFDNASIDSGFSRYSNVSKKTSLIQKLKRWGKSKDDISALSSPSRSFGGTSPRISVSQRSSIPKGPLEALMLRNAGDGVAITTFGKKEDPPDSPDTPNLPHIRTQASSPSDSLNTVASSFQLMSKSVEGVMDEKYPAYKDRHKLALEREKAIKEKAEQARAERFGDSSNSSIGFENRVKVDREKAVTLPPKLAQVKERVTFSTDSNEQIDDSKGDAPVVSKMKLATLKRGLRGCLDHLLDHQMVLPLLSTKLLFQVGYHPHLVHHHLHRLLELPLARLPLQEVLRKDLVKADVETQGDFVQSLAAEVRAASFTKIEDLVSFVNWLDEELSFLVDERAVLKHFDWPEGKADALREAAFEYQDLMKLEKRVSNFVDDPKLPCEPALKKMYSLLEKVEQSVYALLRTRDMAISRYKEFGIPVDWLMDSGVVGKIKLSSVQLARKYMKRVSSELDALTGTDKEPNREFIVLQGVRFAFRVHQFAGGFDAESMRAFEELRSRVHAQSSEADKSET
ncbi:hypothetical protein QJS10_CPA03g00432 [Acorus calamus]|uniref:Protein CHUP1, chloroplastic n=1 Tax=Acorus calamus TaxID=4465 RepID=A0AAV9F8R0_ACOCL|nr:hypothetical protein QJS10_CPA03g00432 [Acorus calamus]